MSDTMNRAALIDAVAEETGMARVAASQAVDAVFSVMQRALRNRQEVRLTGFGTFVVADRKATKGRNPRTGAEIAVPASASVRFRPGKGLKDAVN